MWKQFSPILIFVAIFLGVSVWLTMMGVEFAFYKMSAIVCVLPAIMWGLLWAPGSWNKRVDDFSKGLADEGIASMLLLFFLAGGFGESVKYIGGLGEAVSLFKSLNISGYVVPAIFAFSCIMSLALGTSMGVIAVVTPFALELAGGDSSLIFWLVGSVVGGSAFGDNLSLVSDTSLAASQTLSVKPFEKFIANAKIAIPAAVVMILIYVFCPIPELSQKLACGTGGNIWCLTPYIMVIALSLLRCPAILSLLISAVWALVLGVGSGKSFLGFVDAYKSGVLEMADVAILSFLLGGLKNFIQNDSLRKLVTSQKSSKNVLLRIAKMGVISDLIFANNTIAILFAGPVAKLLAQQGGVSTARAASVLDIFATCAQCLIPYGAQILLASSMSKLSPVALVGFCFYPMCLGVFAMVDILLCSKKKQDA